MVIGSTPAELSDLSSPGNGRDRSSAHAATDSAPEPGPSQRRQRPLVARVARGAAGGGAVALCALLVWWSAIGGTWLTVSTPSMGRYAPVGTLLWVKPVDIGDIRVGDVISFRRPTTGQGTGPRVAHAATMSSRTYTHRVAAVEADGTLQTKGDINAAPDPWRVRGRDLVGRVTGRWWGVGWLVKALPLLLLGGLAWWALTAVLASDRSRAPLRVLGTAALVAVAIHLYDPLFGATQLSFVPLGEPGARATYVGTGLLPVELRADDVAPVRVRTGHRQSILATHESDDGRFEVQVAPTIPWPTWVVVAAAGLAPAVWSVIVGVEPVEPVEPATPRRRGQRQRRQRRQRP